MDLDKITALIRLVGQSGISELDLSEDGRTIRIRAAKHHPDPVPAGFEGTGSEPTRAAVSAPALQVVEPADKPHAVKAPMFGTFYRASSPQEPPFIVVGDRILAGQVIGVIEAMKTLSRLESDRDGLVTRILAADGEMVEFGQVLVELTE